MTTATPSTATAMRSRRSRPWAWGRSSTSSGTAGCRSTPHGLVDQVFGPAGDRGSLVISGANGIVGAGKTMQLGSRLQPYGVRIVGARLPRARPTGSAAQYAGPACAAFGREGAEPDHGERRSG